METWNKEEWKRYTFYLNYKAQNMEYSIEWINLIKRIKWINENKIYI